LQNFLSGFGLDNGEEEGNQLVAVKVGGGSVGAVGVDLGNFIRRERPKNCELKIGKFLP
jgi:hypothetical protein